MQCSEQLLISAIKANTKQTQLYEALQLQMQQRQLPCNMLQTPAVEAKRRFGHLRCLLGPDREILCARSQLIKALGGVDLAQDAFREEGSLATLVAQEYNVQCLRTQLMT